MRRQELLQALLVWAVVQVVAIGAGLTAARLFESARAGFVVSNVGAVVAVVLALRYYIVAVRDRRKP